MIMSKLCNFINNISFILLSWRLKWYRYVKIYFTTYMYLRINIFPRFLMNDCWIFESCILLKKNKFTRPLDSLVGVRLSWTSTIARRKLIFHEDQHTHTRLYKTLVLYNAPRRVASYKLLLELHRIRLYETHYIMLLAESDYLCSYMSLVINSNFGFSQKG